MAAFIKAFGAAFGLTIAAGLVAIPLFAIKSCADNEPLRIEHEKWRLEHYEYKKVEKDDDESLLVDYKNGWSYERDDGTRHVILIREKQLNE